MNDTMIISTGSFVFHLCPPDTYSMTEEFSNKETHENESYQSLRNEKVDGGTRRKDLPKEHADLLGEGYYDLKTKKYLEKIFAPAWVNAFNKTIKDRENAIAIEATMTGVYRPDFYNFETDHVRFDLAIPVASLERIKKEVFAYESVFEEYLHKYNSSVSGFWSWMPNSVKEWRRYYYDQSHPDGSINPDSDRCQKGIVALLEFWLFAFAWMPYNAPRVPSLSSLEAGIEEFREEFDRQVETLTCNGAEEECYDFLPEGSKEYDYAVAHYLSGKPSEIFVA